MRFNEKKYPSLKFNGKSFPQTIECNVSEFRPINYQYFSEFIHKLVQDKGFIYKLLPCAGHLEDESGVILMPHRFIFKEIAYNVRKCGSSHNISIAILNKFGIVGKIFGEFGDLQGHGTLEMKLNEVSDEEHVPVLDSEQVNALAAIIISLLLIKQFAEIEEYVINHKKKRLRFSGEKYFSEISEDVQIIDSNWFREIVRTEGFLVSGHFRLQPYGEGRSKRRLKWINPFSKFGYRKKAKKVV